jgi:uncharacterized RmlC-like cupin family protein
MIIRGKVVKRKVLEKDSTYEPGLTVSDGINNKIVEGARLLMGYSFVPPGGKNQRHYHVNTDAGMYVLKGRVRFILGPDDDRRAMDAETGDFIYTPQGEIHGLINLSDTEPVELIATYNKAGCKEDAGTIFVETGRERGED